MTPINFTFLPFVFHFSLSSHECTVYSGEHVRLLICCHQNQKCIRISITKIHCSEDMPFVAAFQKGSTCAESAVCLSSRSFLFGVTQRESVKGRTCTRILVPRKQQRICGRNRKKQKKKGKRLHEVSSALFYDVSLKVPLCIACVRLCVGFTTSRTLRQTQGDCTSLSAGSHTQFCTKKKRREERELANHRINKSLMFLLVLLVAHAVHAVRSTNPPRIQDSPDSSQSELQTRVSGSRV